MSIADGRVIDETGTLLRRGGGFALRRDAGGWLMLDLPRMPVDHVGKRVRITGRMVAGDCAEVDGLAAEVNRP